MRPGPASLPDSHKRDAEAFVIESQGSPALLDNSDDVQPIELRVERRRPVGQQVAGERMTQHVRMDMDAQALMFCPLRQPAFDGAHAQTSAAATDEQRRFVGKQGTVDALRITTMERGAAE